MPNIKLFLVSVATLIFLSACSANGAKGLSEAPSMSPLDASAQSARLLIKSAELEIDVKEPKKTVNQIKSLVSHESGYVGNIYERNQKRVSMTVKIPAKSLDSFIEQISSMGTLTSKSLSTRDVTEKMIDIKARLTNLKALRGKFRKLLDKAKNVSDVLKIETELSRIQTELDSIEARRKSLRNQIALSRIDITITQKTIYGPFGYIGKGFYWIVKKMFIIK